MYVPPFNDKEAEAGRLGNFPDNRKTPESLYYTMLNSVKHQLYPSIQPFFQYQLGSRHSKYCGINKQVEDIISGFKEFAVYLQK